MIKSHGYPFESHEVVTGDGYVLTMHRIPFARNATTNNGIPVFLQHGLLCSSADWLVTGPDQALAYYLADVGYDVWMGNARGNTHSRKHQWISPETKEFWDFSWHEIGMFDLPAMIDYILETAGAPRLHYAGHSQGTTSFFIMTSMRPEYNDKIITAHMLAPVAFMSNLVSPFVRALAPFVDQVEWIMNMLGVYEFMPTSDMMEKGGYLICRDESPFQDVCANVLFLIGGFNSAQLDRSLIPEILANTPAGAAVGQMVHYGQGVNSGKFRQFDHGITENIKRYGSITPPDYPLEKISCPLALHYSDNDWLAAVKDVNELADKLGSLIGKFRVPDGKFNHLDYQWATEARFLLYDRIVNLMDRYNY